MLKQVLMAAAIAVTAPTVALAADQAPRPVTTYKAPRDAYGHPVIEGNWTNVSMTRLERNPRWGKDLILPEAKAAESKLGIHEGAEIAEMFNVFHISHCD